MGHIRQSVDVDAPVETCWHLLADVERLPEWNTTALEVKDVSGPIDRVGATFTVVGRVAGRRIEGRSEVTRVEPMRLLEYTGIGAGGARGEFRTALEASDNGTRVTVEVQYELPGGWFGTIADKLFGERQLERDARHSTENFKAVAEAEAERGEATGMPLTT